MFYKSLDIKNKRIQSLSLTEVFVLRLTLHEYSDFEIIDFLEIELEGLFKTLNSIKYKLNANSFFQIVVVSFKKGFLNPEDFVNDIVKNQALLYSETITSYLVQPNIDTDIISNLVLEFYTQSEFKIRDNNKEHFSSLEQDYLDLKVKGVNEEVLEKRLKIGYKEADSMQQTLFKKLKTNNWYNALKNAFHLDMISKPNKLMRYTDIEVTNTMSNMISFYTFKNMVLKEKQLAVYNELIRFYTKLELFFLEQVDL